MDRKYVVVVGAVTYDFGNLPYAKGYAARKSKDENVDTTVYCVEKHRTTLCAYFGAKGEE